MKNTHQNIAALVEKTNSTLLKKYSNWELRLLSQNGSFVSLNFKEKFVCYVFVLTDNESDDLTDSEQLVFEVSNIIDACINFKNIT